MLLATAALLIGLLATDDPAPALGGLDPVRLCGGERARGAPERTLRHGRYVYAFASPGCRTGFRFDPTRYVVEPEPLAPVDAERLEAGLAWMGRAVAAHGGHEVARRAETLMLVHQETTDDWGVRPEVRLGRSDAVQQRTSWTPPDEGSEALVTRWALHPGSPRWSFVDEGDAACPVRSTPQLDDLARIALRAGMTFLWNHGDWIVAHRGERELAGERVVDVLLARGGPQTALHLDPDSARIHGLSRRGRLNDGVTRRITDRFTAYTEIDRVLLPNGREVLVDGEQHPTRFGNWSELELIPQPLVPLDMPTKETTGDDR